MFYIVDLVQFFHKGGHMDDEHMKGLLSEERFFKLMEKVSVEWYRGCKRTPRHYDADGFDAFVYIRRIDSAKRVKVPVQIKSSERGRDLHFAKYPDHWRWRVIVIVVQDSRSDEEIRKELCEQLNHVRQGRYDYADLLSVSRERWKRTLRARKRIVRAQCFHSLRTYMRKQLMEVE